MPNGPIDALIFAHTAIEAEARRIEAAAATAETAEALTALARDVAFLRHFVIKHTDGEEVGLFPTLSEQVPNIDRTFLFDHADDKAQFNDLEGQVQRCLTDANGRAFAALRRQTVVVTEHLALHIRKENELILPMVGGRFNAEAQAGMVQKILSGLTPAETEASLPFIVRSQPDESAVAYVTILSRMMPPPVFARARGWIQAGVPPERWALLVSRVPALTA